MKLKLFLIAIMVLLVSLPALAEDIFVYDKEMKVVMEFENDIMCFVEKFKLEGEPVAVIKINKSC